MKSKYIVYIFVFLILVFSVNAVPIANNLILEVTGDTVNTNGNIVVDLRGLHNGTITGAVTSNWTTAKYGQSLNFSGTTSHVAFWASSIFNNSLTNFTATGWFYILADDKYLFCYPFNALCMGFGAWGQSYKISLSTTGGAVGSSSTTTINAWHYLSVTYNNSIVRFYIDGVPISNASITKTSQSGSQFWLGKDKDNVAGAMMKGLIDEFMLFNYTLTDSDIAWLYNNGTFTATQQYPFNYTIPLNVPTYNVTLNSTPNINTSVMIINVTATIQANNTNLTGDTMNLYYKPVTSLNNNCSIFYQKTCVSGNDYLIKNMTKINSTSFYTTLSDNNIYPAYYPYNYTIIDNTIHQNYTAYSNNNILFKIYNFSTQATNYNILLEMDTMNKSGVVSALLIYYCNSSYTTGNPSLRDSCELIDSFASNTFLHNHNQSKHQVLPVVIQNITKTQLSYIVFVANSNINNGWNFEYITNSNYDNTSFEEGTFTNWNSTQTYTNKIFDIHIHAFNNVDYLTMYSVLNDNATLTNSNTITDFYDLVPFAPSGVDTINPVCNQQFTLGLSSNTTILFNWTKSTSINNMTITYNLSVTNLLSNTFIVGNLNQSTNYYSWSLNKNTLIAGNYYTMINSCDNFGLCDLGVQSCTFNICYNSYYKSTQPCVDNSKKIVYSDSNNCNQMLDIPSDNNTYEECISIVYQQAVLKTDYIVIGILFLFLIVALICAITIHEAFFGLCTLIVALMMSTFIYYGYPQILTYLMVFCILLFSVMWIVIRTKRN
jgi:hypothetical protein